MVYMNANIKILAFTYFTIRGTAIDVSGRRCEISSRKTDWARSTEMDRVIFSPPRQSKKDHRVKLVCLSTPCTISKHSYLLYVTFSPVPHLASLLIKPQICLHGPLGLEDKSIYIT